MIRDTISAVLSALKFRLYPNRAQADRLSLYIDHSRNCYNKALEQRIHALSPRGKGINYQDQQAQLTKQRAVSEEMRDIPCDVQRDGLRRADTAFKNFFRRCREGAKKKGFPRFKGKNRFSSITLTNPGIQPELFQGRIRIPGIRKSIRVRGLQLSAAQIKRITISHRGGKWHGRLLVDDKKDAPAKKPITKSVGIDVGLNAFVATSNGELVECPKHYRRLQPRLKRAQRLVSRRKKGSNRRAKAVLNVQRIHEHIEGCREDFLHKLSKRLVQENDLIATEKLNIRGMVRSNLAKSILDAGWGRFNWMLSWKAESAGKTFVQVDPKGTSQLCSQCGETVPKKLSERMHICNCGCSLDRDVNASRNVLARAVRISTPDQALAGNAHRELASTVQGVPESQAGSLKCAG